MAKVITTSAPKLGDFGFFFAGDIVRSRAGRTDWRVVELLGNTHARLENILTGATKDVFKFTFRAV